MSSFENITVIREANVYFDGNVTSRTLVFPDGTKKTLGVMLPGVYEFGTADKELMEILSGKLAVMLPDAAEWVDYSGGDAFEVPASSTFKLKVSTVTDYCCSFLAQD